MLFSFLTLLHLFALLAAWWALGPAPAEDRTLWFLWTALPILAGGPVLMVRLHAVAGRTGGPANTAVMGLFLAAGLALVANVADTPTDTALALALGAALAGFLVGPVLVARVGFGSTALLALGTVLVFLAGEGSRYLTGNTLFVDGGSHINGVAWAPDLGP